MFFWLIVLFQVKWVVISFIYNSICTCSQGYVQYIYIYFLGNICIDVVCHKVAEFKITYRCLFFCNVWFLKDSNYTKIWHEYEFQLNVILFNLGTKNYVFLK